MPDLITLSDLRLAQGKGSTDTRDDELYSQMIPWASDAVLAYTERDFGAPLVTEDRIFEYDGSGYLDIDDATTITAVKLVYPYGQPDVTLDSYDWTPKPQRRDDSSVYSYIQMPGYAGSLSGISPAMGFTWNLDRYTHEHGFSRVPSVVKVTATWGWGEIPGDVKIATIWTLQEWLSRPSGEGLTAEAIEGWSRSWGSKSTGSTTTAMAIPARARDLLSRYAKVAV